MQVTRKTAPIPGCARLTVPREKRAPCLAFPNPRRVASPTVSPSRLPGRRKDRRPHPGWQAGFAASPLLSGPGHLRSHPRTGRTGRRLLNSRGLRLPRRPGGGESIRGCGRTRGLLHGGAPRGTCPNDLWPLSRRTYGHSRREPRRGRVTQMVTRARAVRSGEGRAPRTPPGGVPVSLPGPG